MLDEKLTKILVVDDDEWSLSAAVEELR